MPAVEQRAGVVAALVGFTSSFAVVLAGLRAVGASPGQAASGLLVLCAAQGIGTIVLSRRHRMPLLLAWSTPGAALLASTGSVDGGWQAAVGAFALCGGLILLTAAWPRLGALIAAIPTPIAQAMLAGVLLSLCLAPVTAVVVDPLLVGPVLVAWVVLARFAPRWAVPGAFVVAMAVIAVEYARHPVSLDLWPQLEFTTPRFAWGAVLGVALPLYVVTMASQNVPGVAVMASYGYTVPWRPAMTMTGLGTAAGAFGGGHAINLAAITAALTAAPDAHPDADRRWRAAQTAGVTYIVLAALSAAVAAYVAVAPLGVIEAVAGVALLGTLGSSLAAAAAPVAGREAALVTFVVAASGVSAVNIGAAFWALAAGLATHAVLTVRPRQPLPPAA